MSKTNPARLDHLRRKLLTTRDIGEKFMRRIEALPGSSERTSAKARAEEAVAFVQKLLDDLA